MLLGCGSGPRRPLAITAPSCTQGALLFKIVGTYCLPNIHLALLATGHPFPWESALPTLSPCGLSVLTPGQAHDPSLANPCVRSTQHSHGYRTDLRVNFLQCRHWCGVVERSELSSWIWGYDAGISGVLQVGSVCPRLKAAQRKTKPRDGPERGPKSREQTPVLRMWFEPLDPAAHATRTYL